MRAWQRTHHQLMESMTATDKAQQELEQIERQVAEMESSDPDAATRRQIASEQPAAPPPLSQLIRQP